MSTNVEKPKKSLFAGKKEKASKKKPKPEKKVTKVPKEKSVKTKTNPYKGEIFKDFKYYKEAADRAEIR